MKKHTARCRKFRKRLGERKMGLELTPAASELLAREIEGLIRAAAEQTESGSTLVNQAGGTMDEVRAGNPGMRGAIGPDVGLFEAAVEEKLWQPTFIIDYPVEVSPLARASDSNPAITERFELFITGREYANGFSELNDAEDQAARFQAQVANKDAGDEEAMYYDADFIRALEVGMPPAFRRGDAHVAQPPCGLQPVPLPLPQPRRALLLQAQALPRRRHALRKARGQLPRARQARRGADCGSPSAKEAAGCVERLSLQGLAHTGGRWGRAS